MDSVYAILCLLISVCTHLKGATNALEPASITVNRVHYEQISPETTFPEKNITVLIYIAARNDLAPFVERNLMQLMQIGSNTAITFAIYLCSAHHGKQKITQRFIVYKNRLVQVGDDAPEDSGDPATLIKACEWAFTKFPARNTVLILWDHGTGCIEPQFRKAIHPSELYRYNPATDRIELNRSINFLDYIGSSDIIKGICFDNITKHYLTNHDVGEALRHVVKNSLKGKPIDILCTDACLMQGLGFIYSLYPPTKSPAAHYILGSQEIVLATGYPYTHLFSKAAENSTINAQQLAQHIVGAFATVYREITEDYTHSAIDLFAIQPLYHKLNSIAQLLTDGMKHEANRSVHKLIATASNKNNCTSFEEPSYKDLYHFLNNILKGLSSIQLKTQQATTALQQSLRQEISDTFALLKQIIIANEAGKNLANATGLSIYIPHDTIHGSFPSTDFGRETAWLTMLNTYLKQ